MTNNSQPLQIEASPTTIKQPADRLRTSLARRYGEAHFAKLCVEFDRQVCAISSARSPGKGAASQKEAIETLLRYATVLCMLACKPEALIVQLALIWLDGHGWGGMSLLRLAELILETKQAYWWETAPNGE